MIQNGDKVKMTYIAAVDNEIIEESKQPLEFTVGANQVLKVFDREVVGMELGQEKDFIMTPEMGFGQHQPDLISKIPKSKFGQEVGKGSKVTMNIGGKEVHAHILDADENEVTADLNHPMAGKNVQFRIKILEVEKPV